jgi:protein gp37
MANRVGPHCEHASPGCEHCYSETNNGRCLRSNGTGLPFDRRARDLVDIYDDDKILVQPLRWQRPRRIFVENQSDLFGEWNPSPVIATVFRVMREAHWHQFQVLSKHADRMREFLVDADGIEDWPLPNVWLGSSTENQAWADKRIPDLLETPAAVRYISAEPLLGHVDLTSFLTARMAEDGASRPALDWVIVGGESGPHARPMQVSWTREIVEQCKVAGVACFVKQLGAKPHDVVSDETSLSDLRVREMPATKVR